MRNKKKIQPKEVVFQVCMIVLFSIIVLSCIYPFYYIFIASISSPDAVQKSTITWYPLEPTLKNYKQIFELNGILRAFFVSVARDGGRDCGNVVFYKYSGIYVNKKRTAVQKILLFYCNYFHVYQCRINPVVSDNAQYRIER